MQTKNSSKLRSLLSTGPNRSCRAEQLTVLIRCQSKSASLLLLSSLLLSSHCIVWSYLYLAFPNIYLYIFIIASSPLWVDILSSLGKQLLKCLRLVLICSIAFDCYRHMSFIGLPKLTHTHHSFMPPVAIL
jgi:hypothetical protein